MRESSTEWKVQNACSAATRIWPSKEHSLSTQRPVATTALKHSVLWDERVVTTHRKP
jgi:hypothetical protein